MKKFLFYVAAIAVLASCSEAELDDMTPNTESSATTEVTISVDINESSDTRVALDDNWDISWTEGDALLAIYNDGSYGESKFTMDTYGASSSTFTGSVSGISYWLIYPYSDSYARNGSVVTLDLSTQSEGATLTYMQSDKILTSENDPQVTMKHLGATAELQMKNIDATYKGYTLQSVDVSGLISSAKVDLENNYLALSNKTEGTISISDGVTTVDDNCTAEVRFNLFPSTIAASTGAITITAYLNDGSGSVVALTKTITNSSAAAVEFARATYNTIVCDFSEATTPATYWTAYAATAFSDQSAGDEGDPILISSAEELALIAKNVNADNSITYEGTYFQLANDIDLTGYMWEPIGSSSYSFKGTFLGDNKTISGLYINASNAYQGLFGAIAGATIQDLTVSGSISSTTSYVGGIVAFATTSTSTITNCHNRCSLTSKYNYVGGIVGSNTYGTITGCTNSGTIYAGSNAGGIVGNNQSSGTIENCYNTASVSGTGGYVGGVVGKNAGNIKNSYNTAEVKGVSYVGGVVGYATAGTILNCYNTASATGTVSYVGGVVGYCIASNSADVYIYNSYNRGSVSGVNYVGGVAGCLMGYYNYVEPTFSATKSNLDHYATIQNCYSASSVTATTTYPGGAVGYIFSYSKISYCYWDNDFWNENTNGYGHKDNSNVTVSNLTGQSTTAMTDGTVLDLLNTSANMPTEACSWVAGLDGYPTLDF